MSLTLTIDDGAVIERIAQRAAEILAERQASVAEDDGYIAGAKAAAAFLDCPESRIKKLTSAGRIPHEKEGHRLLFRKADLRAYVASGGAVAP